LILCENQSGELRMLHLVSKRIANQLHDDVASFAADLVGST
jgi:hypothetical protein